MFLAIDFALPADVVDAPATFRQIARNQALFALPVGTNLAIDAILEARAWTATCSRKVTSSTIHVVKPNTLSRGILSGNWQAIEPLGVPDLDGALLYCRFRSIAAPTTETCSEWLQLAPEFVHWVESGRSVLS